MARQTQISTEEIQRAKQLRDQATTIAEYRKALSVILAADHGLDADRTAELLGTSRRTVFVTVVVCAVKATLPKTYGWSPALFYDIEEEREFLAQWIDKATIGGVLTVPPIHAALVNGWVVTSPCQRLIAYWRVTTGERCNRTQSIQRAILHCRTNLKKILRSGGSRLFEKRREASAAVDVSR